MNDILVRGQLHIAMTAMTLLGALMLANLFGELSLLVKQLKSREIKQQSKIDRAESVMTKLRVKKNL